MSLSIHWSFTIFAFTLPFQKYGQNSLSAINFPKLFKIKNGVFGYYEWFRSKILYFRWFISPYSIWIMSAWVFPEILEYINEFLSWVKINSSLRWTWWRKHVVYFVWHCLPVRFISGPIVWIALGVQFHFSRRHFYYIILIRMSLFSFLMLGAQHMHGHWTTCCDMKEKSKTITTVSLVVSQKSTINSTVRISIVLATVRKQNEILDFFARIHVFGMIYVIERERESEYVAAISNSFL